MANKNTITTEFLGLNLASPIVLLSGCVGFGDEYTRLEGFSNNDIGGAVLKGTTLEPRLGNVPHRVYETPSGMLNSIGLQNPGVHEVVENILPSLEPFETHYIANVSGSTIDEYVEVCRLFDQSKTENPQNIGEMLLSSPDHRGATGPMLFSITSNIEFVGQESVTVKAGTFDALHYRFVGTPGLPQEHPPYDIWCTNDEDFLFLKGKVGGYMQTYYELVELKRS